MDIGGAGANSRLAVRLNQEAWWLLVRDPLSLEI